MASAPSVRRNSAKAKALSAFGRFAIFAAAAVFFLAMFVLMDYAVNSSQGLSLLYKG